ncbi:unnamed protein product [Ceratitis capitata]|uniref:(Mediterranean fruit fly) hypothetical protein n=1 Tax=Ceratitis capitata TaxID=7213 RepID=A0A811VDL3_CERCA|nr:unnamed protein product [Ceratitis capitata]
MSTVASTRTTLTQQVLPINVTPASPPPAIVVNSTESGVSSSTSNQSIYALAPLSHKHNQTPLFEQLCALRRRRVVDMHPDCMLLQAHGVTSPRLSPSVTVLAGEKRRDHTGTMSMDATSVDEIKNMCDDSNDSTDEMDVVGDDEIDEGGRLREINELEAKTAAARLSGATTPHCVDEVDETGEEDDALSLCSEDSELSVGQEVGGNTNVRTVSNFCDYTQQRRLLLSNVGSMMALCAPSAFSSVQAPASACGDGSDARSSASTDDNTLQQLDDESIGSSTGNALQSIPAPLTPQSPPQTTSAILDPYVVANALRMPVPVLPRAANHTSAFQSELMRKSHMYAEELMKQQMQFMAAARASAFTLRGEAIAPDRRAFARMPATPQQMSNFVGIQSQLTAITKMSQLSAAAAAAAVAVAAVANNTQTSQQQQQQQQNKSHLSSNADALSKLSALTSAHTQLSPSTASAVSSLSQLQAQMQAHFPYAHSNHLNNNNLNNNNNNLNEPALKFSIDNILKADFGRRLAEGAACMAACNNITRAAKCSGSNSNSNSALQRARKAANALATGSVSGNSALAIDLTHLNAAASTATTTSASTATLNFSHTLANICTNSSDSSSTAVSSSFGGVSEHAKSPAAATAGNGDFSASASKCAATELSAKVVEDTTNSGGSSTAAKSSGTGASGSGPIVWPAWVYCTRYSDRPSSGKCVDDVTVL